MTDKPHTPYDSGERLEPMPWVKGDVASPGGLPRRVTPDDYGRVDFDNDEGATMLTAYVEPDPTGGYVMRVIDHAGAGLRVQVEQ